MSVVFLGGFFLPDRAKSIEADSKIFVQYAADALQRNLVTGLAASISDLKVVNLPFIGSFPQAYRSFFYRGSGKRQFGSVPVYEPNFINARFLRIPSRFWKSLFGIMKAGRADYIVIYSAYLPFIAAAIAFKAFRPGLRITLILPDLIEYMGSGGGRWRRTIVSIETTIFSKMLKQIDGFVLLTGAMAERLGISSDRCLVLEGMIDQERIVAPITLAPDEKRDITYTGTLDRRYGIVDLIEAFAMLEEPRIELKICGAGDAENEVRDAARRDPRIVFAGRVGPEEALRIQRDAFVLVNPRRPEGEFTKYSFPSKTLEYMATGRPVVMHRLPGIPDEYLPHIICPHTPDARGLAGSLREVLRMGHDAAQAAGVAAQTFVLENKTSELQCKKLSHWILAGKEA